MASLKFNIKLSDRGNSGYLVLFSSESSNNSKSIIQAKNPLKIGSVDKYFKTEADLDTIKQSLLETPRIYTFDQVYSEIS